MMSNPNKPQKKKTAVNEIEKVYVTEGVYSKKFTEQLLAFIGYVLNRYSNGANFGDDMLNFTYLRVMERLGAILPEAPEASYPFKDDESYQKHRTALEKWNFEGKKCLFDASRSNLGNYIFSIARNAHSNFTYHRAKKFKELDPPSTEIPEPSRDYTFEEENKSKVLELNTEEPELLPIGIRRYLLWKQNA